MLSTWSCGLSLRPLWLLRPYLFQCLSSLQLTLLPFTRNDFFSWLPLQTSPLLDLYLTPWLPSQTAFLIPTLPLKFRWRMSQTSWGVSLIGYSKSMAEKRHPLQRAPQSVFPPELPLSPRLTQPLLMLGLLDIPCHRKPIKNRILPFPSPATEDNYTLKPAKPTGSLGHCTSVPSAWKFLLPDLRSQPPPDGQGSDLVASSERTSGHAACSGCLLSHSPCLNSLPTAPSR